MRGITGLGLVVGGAIATGVVIGAAPTMAKNAIDGDKKSSLVLPAVIGGTLIAGGALIMKGSPGFGEWAEGLGLLAGFGVAGMGVAALGGGYASNLLVK